MLRYIGRISAIAVDTLLLAPRRRRRHLGRTGPYRCRTRDGLLFDLEPGQWVDHQIATYGVAERRFLELMSGLLPRDAVVVDIGANIGNHALFLSRRVAQVHCFEPNPTAWSRLEANIAANRIENIAVHRVGLGQDDESARFRENIGGNLGASGFEGAGEALPGQRYRTVELPIRNADRQLAELGLDRLDYIKIDVEGLEEQVLGALGQTIARFRPMVSFEFHGHLTGIDAFDRMRELLPGYRLFELEESPDGGSLTSRIGWLLRHAARPRLNEVSEAQARTYDNLLAVPEDSDLLGSLLPAVA